nr:uncharacterized protein LOC123859782 isoform X5 [Mirounga angustirostris]
MRGPVQPRAFRPRSACQPGGTDYQRFCSGIGKGPSMSHLSLEQRTQEGFELNTRQDFSIMRDVRPQRGRPNWDLPIQESPKTHRDCVWLCSPWRHPSHPGPCLTQRRCSMSKLRLKSTWGHTEHESPHNGLDCDAEFELTFPRGLWNDHQGTCDKMPRTSNSGEGFHITIQSSFTNMHPSFWKQILLKEEISVKIEEVRC